MECARNADDHIWEGIKENLMRQLTGEQPYGTYSEVWRERIKNWLDRNMNLEETKQVKKVKDGSPPTGGRLLRFD